jgi:hypothetical protein
MKGIYFLTYHAKPKSISLDYKKYLGAYINCYIEEELIEQAEKIARQEIANNSWQIIAHEDGFLIDPKDISENGKRFFEQAKIDKMVFCYHTYDSSEELNESFPNDLAVFTTRFVLDDKKTITFVSHELEDNSWQFFSDDKFDDFNAVAKVVGFNEILEIDPSLIDLISLEPGYHAKRKDRNDIWKIGKVT